MMRKPSRSALAAISLLCVVLMAACSSGSPVIRSIKVSPTSASVDASATLPANNTQQFTATALYSDGSTKDVTATAQWASSNSAVAAINSSGLATAANPPDTTTVTITAQAGGQPATATLTVVHDIQSISVAPLAASVALGLPQKYTATGTYGSIANTTHTEDVTSISTWASSNTNVAAIDGSGNATTLGKTTGVTNITASITKTGGATTITSSPAAVLTVTAAVPASLQVTPATPSVAVGGVTTLLAQVLDSNQQVSAVTGPVTWATSACTPAGAVLLAAINVTNHASINANGQAVGSCKVTATQGALTGNTTVNVVAGTSHFAYVANTVGPNIGGWKVDATSATPFTPLTPATFSVPGDAAQVVVSPNGKYAYLVDSLNFVHVYTVSSAGALTLPTEPSTKPNVGTNFTHSVIDPTGRFFITADNGGDAVHSAVINAADGTLGTVSTVSGVGGPEFVAVDRQGKYAYFVSDDDTVRAFAINQTNGTLTPLSTPSYALATGAGPFAVTVDPSNKFVYTANNLNGTVSLFTLDSTTGLLTAKPDFTVTGAVNVFNVIVDPASKYLFVLDSGDVNATPTPKFGKVYGFNIDSTTGVIGTALAGTPATTEYEPTGLAIDATGTLLATDNNFGSTTDGTGGSISLFKIGAAGAVTATTPPIVTSGSAPLYVTFLNAP